jgi:GNAT superfamily N-acetyltransferase
VSSTPELRFALDPDLNDGLSAQLIDLWLEVSNAGGAVGFVPPVDRKEVARVARSSFARIESGDDRIVVACRGDDPVAFLFLIFRPGALFQHWATIKRLMVHPSLQGTGIGGALLDETHKLGRQELGLEQMHLTVRGGTGTEAFYERHGYEVIARIPDVIRVAPDDTREEIYMVKRL